MLKLRIANADDCAPLFDIHRSVFRSHIDQLWQWDESWQLANFKSECNSTITSVIEVDGQIAGYMQIIDRKDQIYVQNIAIAETFQGNGIGTRLLKMIQSKANARKVPVHLGVFRTNGSAQKLYERLGFYEVGETPTHIEMSWTAPNLETKLEDRGQG